MPGVVLIRHATEAEILLLTRARVNGPRNEIKQADEAAAIDGKICCLLAIDYAADFRRRL
jgi:hypothetical protein